MSSDLSYVLNNDVKRPFLTLNMRIFILKGVLRGLQYIHEHDVINLDIKPGNIMLSKGLKAKISDFGLSQRIEDRIKRKVGTKGYAAPEVYFQKCEKKSDYYSFGVLFYVTMVTAAHKFYRDKPLIKTTIKRRLKDIPEDILEQIAETIMNYTNEDPSLRLPLLAGVINIFSDIELALSSSLVPSRNQSVKMEGFGLKLFSGPVNMLSREDGDQKITPEMDSPLGRNL